MTTLALPFVPSFRPLRGLGGRTLLLGATALLVALLGGAFGRQLLLGRPLLPARHVVWLTIHLLTVIPAVPLGGWVVLARKGTAAHRRLGRLWAGLMVAAALSSFGIRGTGHLSWIHGLALVTLVGIARGVWLATRREIAGHRQAMTRVYLGLVIAGFFTFLPGRLLGQWLFG